MKKCLFKKFFSFILALALVFSILPISSDKVYAATATDEVIFIPLYSGNKMAKVNISTEQSEELTVGTSPNSATMDANGLIYVSNRGSRTISVIDSSDFTLKDTITLTKDSTSIYGVTIDPSMENLYIGSKNGIIVYNLNDKTKDRILTDKEIYYCSVTEDYVYAVEYSRKNFFKYDLKTKTTDTLELDGKKYLGNLSPDEKTYVVTTESSLSSTTIIIDVENMTSRSIDKHSYFADFSFDGNYLYLMGCDNVFYIYKLEDLSLVSSVSVNGSMNYTFGISKDGNKVYAVSYMGKKIDVINISDINNPSIIKTISLSAQPYIAGPFMPTAYLQSKIEEHKPEPAKYFLESRPAEPEKGNAKFIIDELEYASKDDVAVGTSVEIIPVPFEGYDVEKILLEENDPAESVPEVTLNDEGKYIFEMLERDTHITVYFRERSYDIASLPCEHGSVSLSASGMAPYNTTVEVIITPEDGYEVDTVKYKNVNTNEEVEIPASADGYKFIMPAAVVEVYATFKPSHSHSGWTYSVENANELVATCHGEGECDLPNKKVSITLTATSQNYSGITDLEAFNTATGKNIAENDVEIYKVDAADTTTGGTKVTGTPSEDGYYYAQLTVETATAVKAFTIGTHGNTTQPTSFNVPVSTTNGTSDFSGTVGVANTWYFQTDAQNTLQTGDERISFFASDDNSKGYDAIYQSTIIILADEDLNSWVDSSTPLPNGVSLKKSYNLSNNIGDHPDRLYAWFKFEGMPQEKSSAPLPKINIPKEILEFTTDGGKTWYHATSDIQIDLSLSLGNWSITSNSSHEHDWEYSLVGTDTIKAHCKAEGHEGDDVNITLSANSANYSGSPATIYVGSEAERTAWTSAGLEIPSTSYVKEDGTPLDSAPTDAGSYVAKITVGEQTAQVSFTIQQNHGEDTSQYAADDTHHWNPCLRTNCDEGHKYNEDAHSYDNDTHKCVCGKTDPDIHQHSFATAWSTDADNHWHECTAEGYSSDCLIDTGAAKAPHGSWIDGKCGICGYECQHNGATSGVCGICTKDLDSGSTPKPNPTPGGDRSNAENAAAPTIPTDYVAERVAEEEAMEVTVVTIDTTQYSKNEETVVPGTSYNLSKFITTKGIVKGIKTAVDAANKDKKDTIEIYSGKPFCFNKEIIKTIQESKKTVVYYFHYKGHIYSVTVPATVDASKVLEKAGFAGPLYVGQQLGTTKLVK